MTSQSGSMRFVRTVALNLLIFFVVANLLYWAIPVGGTISRYWKSSGAESLTRQLPAAYGPEAQAWLRTYWTELNRMTGVYKSYIGWRTGPMHGETINVEGRYLQRRTINAEGVSGKRVYFFGGSTMWGIGTNDAGTIPSQFAALTGLHAENFGESAYVVHQNLLLLIQLLQEGHRPDLVIFYDGANDALHKCRIELTPLSHEREYQMQTLLRQSSRPDSFLHYFAPIVAVAQKTALTLSRGSRSQHYNCQEDAKKSENIAESMFLDWRLAKQLVEGYGGTFVGILQPVAYFSRTRLDRSTLSDEEEAQYKSIYPIMRDKIARGREFYDLVSVLDRDEEVYIDWCHLVPKGNRYVVDRIAEIVAPLGFKR